MALTSYIYAPDVSVNEAALSDGGNWLTGAPTNFWKAPKVVNGVICGSSANDADADDSFAYPDPARFSFGTDYYMAATVRRLAGYTNTAGQEVELHAQLKPAAGVQGGQGTATSIEITFQFLDTPSSQSLQPVIWTGQPGQFDADTLGGSTVSGGFEILDGDELAIRKAGNNFFIYHNDNQICTFSNNTVPDGSPAIGFFYRTGGTPEAYGFRKVKFTAGANMLFVPQQVFSASTRQFTIPNINSNLSLVNLRLSRVSWPVGTVGSINVECALNGVSFSNIGGTSLAGGSGTFKGRPITGTSVVTDIPGKGTPGRALRFTFVNTVSLTSAPRLLLF